MTGTRAKLWVAAFVAVLGIAAMSVFLRVMDDKLRSAADSGQSPSTPSPQPSRKAAPTVMASAALLRAAVTGNVIAVKYALDNGVPPDARDRIGNTSLCLAARYGRIAVMRMLMQANADVNARGSDNRTPLHWAAANLQFDMIVELLARGADPNALDANNETPRDLAFDSPGPAPQVRAVCQLLELAELGKAPMPSDR